MKKIVFAATAALFAIGSTAAMAQTTPAPAVTAPAAPKVVAPLAKPPAAPATTAAPAATAAKPAAPAAKKTIGVALTETSKKCSADADAQSLKGKPRKAFRAKCIKEANAAAKKN
jgi:psiF repeat